jgi:hypothetical protein
VGTGGRGRDGDHVRELALRGHACRPDQRRGDPGREHAGDRQQLPWRLAVAGTDTDARRRAHGGRPAAHGRADEHVAGPAGHADAISVALTVSVVLSIVLTVAVGLAQANPDAHALPVAVAVSDAHTDPDPDAHTDADSFAHVVVSRPRPSCCLLSDIGYVVPTDLYASANYGIAHA